jgi:hypothetical protein
VWTWAGIALSRRLTVAGAQCDRLSANAISVTVRSGFAHLRRRCNASLEFG